MPLEEINALTDPSIPDIGHRHLVSNREERRAKERNRTDNVPVARVVDSVGLVHRAGCGIFSRGSSEGAGLVNRDEAF